MIVITAEVAAMSNSVQKAPTRTVVIFSFSGVQLLDIAGPAQAFTTANDEEGRPIYSVKLIALGPNSGQTASGLVLLPSDAGLSRPIDTVILPGGPGIYALRSDRRAMRKLRSIASRARRICAVCTGAFGLAEIGLLQGRKAVTHWRSCGRLAKEYPGIEVDPDPLFLREGNVWTSAGVTAGIDLTLALIEEDVGAEVALRVARRLVVYMRRSGGQRQYSGPLELQSLGSARYGKLLSTIASQPAINWTVERMSCEAGQSERTFQRSFLTNTGVTPGKAVARIRVDLARSLLESTDLKIAKIAHKVGFSSEAALRRSLQRQFGTSPHELRARFQSPSSP
jgi:transcriptional regulator GlxA family with amidase domain